MKVLDEDGVDRPLTRSQAEPGNALGRGSASPREPHGKQRLLAGRAWALPRHEDKSLH